MVGIPKKALRESNLDPIKQNEGSEVNDGSHKIYRVKFSEDGVSKDGFYKKLNSDTYPELLAKISVAASSFMRLFQGKRSAEERLVFDDKDRLVGSLSISIDGFRPFNYINEPVPTDPVLKEQVIPSLKTLIDNNIIELLLGRWFFGCDDGHPHNLGLKGQIDFDMFFYWFTIHIKKPREVIGIPVTRIDLSVRDFEAFPNVLDAKPYHWPTYQSPGEVTLPQIVPGQGQLLSRVLPKAYADPMQFVSLAHSSKAQEQKLEAALKILLTFQPDVQRKRLIELFGDLPFNYISLEQISVDLRKTYEEKYPQLCNKDKNNCLFIDIMMELYQEHYDSLYRLVVFFMGCKDNGYGLPLPATFSALYQQPSLYKNIVNWVTRENETTYKPPDEIKYNLDDLRRRYHQIWRDAFAPSLKELLYNAYSLANRLLIEATLDAKLVELASKQPTDNSLTSSWELFGSVPELSLEAIRSMIMVDKGSSLQNALLLLVEFINKFRSLVKTYYTKARHELTEKDNYKFFSDLNVLMTHEDFNVTIRQQLMNTTTHAKDFGSILSKLKLIAEQINFSVHLTMDDEQMQQAQVVVWTHSLPIIHERVLQDLVSYLFNWVNGLPSDSFERYINEIVDQYSRDAILPGMRTRGPEVTEYLLQSKSEGNANRLAYILASGRTEDGALNTLIVKKFTPLMLQKHPIPSIDAALKDGSFINELSSVTKAVVSYARDNKQFTHFHSPQMVREVYQTLYDWADSIEKNQFLGIVRSSLSYYLKNKSWMTYSREEEVNSYLKHSDLWHARVLALIFSRGEASSSLSDALFSKLIIEMKKDIIKNSVMQKEPRYQVVMQFDLEKYKTFYLKQIKTHEITLSIAKQTEKPALDALIL